MDRPNKKEYKFVIPAKIINPAISKCRLYVIKNEQEILTMEEVGIQSFVLFGINQNLIDIKISNNSLSKLYDDKIFIMDIVSPYGTFVNGVELDKKKRNIIKSGSPTFDYKV